MSGAPSIAGSLPLAPPSISSLNIAPSEAGSDDQAPIMPANVSGHAVAALSSSPSTFPKRDLLAQFSGAQKSSKTAQLKAVGGKAFVTAPMNLVSATFKGANQDHALKSGNISGGAAPGEGLFAILLGIAAAAKALKESTSDVKKEVIAAGQALNYFSIKSRLSIKEDSIGDLLHLLSCIPDDKVSEDPASGHTMVKIKENHIIDVNALLARADANAKRGAEVRIKARDVTPLLPDSLELCKIEEKEAGHIKLYIPRKIETSHLPADIADGTNKSVGSAGLRFFELLETAIDGRK